MPSTLWIREICEEAAGTWWVEPALATAVFAVSINAFGIAEALSEKNKKVGNSPKSRDLLYWLGLRPLSLVTPAAGLAYWAGIFLWTSVVSPPNTPSGCLFLFTFDDLWRVVAEVVLGVLAYDALFFLLHVAMHRGPTWFGRTAGHRRHHQVEGNVRAHHVLQHSLTDGAMQVLVNILVQRNSLWGPKMRVSRWVHNIIVPYLLTESHASIERLPVSDTFPRLLSGVRGHRWHHRTGGAPYQQFFGYLDWIFFGFPMSPTSNK